MQADTDNHGRPDNRQHQSGDTEQIPSAALPVALTKAEQRKARGNRKIGYLPNNMPRHAHLHIQTVLLTAMKLASPNLGILPLYSILLIVNN
jgi:hypothetical protein